MRILEIDFSAYFLKSNEMPKLLFLKDSQWSIYDENGVYLSPYSPELNPIEQFWALVKRKVRHKKLQGTKTFQDRIVDAANEVPIQYLEN